VTREKATGISGDTLMHEERTRDIGQSTSIASLAAVDLYMFRLQRTRNTKLRCFKREMNSCEMRSSERTARFSTSASDLTSRLLLKPKDKLFPLNLGGRQQNRSRSFSTRPWPKQVPIQVIHYIRSRAATQTDPAKAQAPKWRRQPKSCIRTSVATYTSILNLATTLDSHGTWTCTMHYSLSC